MDLSVLDGMARDLGADTVITLVRSYLSDTGLRRDAIERALAADDRPALEREAHTLKGMAGNLGIDPVFRTAQDIVLMCRSNDHDRAKQAVPRLIRHMEAARIHLLDRFPDAAR